MIKHVILPVCIVGQVAAAVGATEAKAIDLQCEFESQPTGLHNKAPRLSWKMDDPRSGAKQTARLIEVAESPEALEKGDLVWSSGKVSDDNSLNISYKGPALKSQQSYFWRVKLWDKDNKETAYSKTATWRMGLINPNDWKAKWIAAEAAEHTNDANSLKDVKWIWYPGDNGATKATSGTKYLRYDLEIPPDTEIDSAQMWWLVDDLGDIKINGKDVARGHSGYTDIKPFISAGKNKLSIAATNTGNNPAAVAVNVIVKTSEGSIIKAATGQDGWMMSNDKTDSATIDLPADQWVAAEVLGNLGMAPWGEQKIPEKGGPANLFRRNFPAASHIKEANLAITALGSYRASLNGKRVGEDILTPEWTDYKKRVLYQTYNVTDLLKENTTNTIGVTVGDGWYASGLGWKLQRYCFGDPPPRFMAQLEIQYADGRKEIVTTDKDWQTTTSPIMRSELYAGETYDARLELAGWNTPSFKTIGWNEVIQPKTPDLIIEGQVSPPVRVTEELKPVSIKETKTGTYVVDFGQNMVGWVRLKVQGNAGDKVTMRFAEILKDDGNIYTDNLRSAEATDHYTLKGGEEEIFEPHFTYHGFRYVEVTGFPGTLTPDHLLGRVFHTDLKKIGEIKTDNALVNKIALNTLWGIRGNIVSVPTDCPQRDERLGWLGDAQAIWRTLSYKMDIASFSEKWMTDVIDAQSAAGGFPNVAPRVISMEDGAPAWGDAGVIVPYVTWKQTGDIKIVEDSWDAMEKWSRFVLEANPDYLWMKRRGNDYGDWVPADSTTDKDLIACSYWAYSTRLMIEMANALGKEDKVQEYADLYNKIREAFGKKFIKPDGKIANGSQTCYILALYNNLVPDELKDNAVKHLVTDIRNRGNHLSTGFLGSTHLMPVLSDNEHHDLAMTLLLNKTYPSWGYMVEKGATTIWERWNSDTGDPAMNSFNHYTYGAVLEWMYEYLAGLKPISPGFKVFQLKPHLTEQLKDISMSFESPYGKIVSNIKQNEKVVTWDVVVPPNTTAEAVFPTSDLSSITVNGKPAKDSNINFTEVQAELVPGTYSFQFAAP